MQRADLFRAVDEHLARLAPAQASVGGRRYGPWHLAAAVLHTFDETLRPAPGPAGDETLDDVLESARAIQMPDGAWRYELDPDVRRAVLKQLKTREQMTTARRANRDAPADAVQQALDSYIDGTARPLVGLDERELAATFEVVAWLHGIIEGVPEQAEVRGALDRIYLLAPFEGLVKKNFAGRVEELTALRNYVGVLPGGAWSWVKERAAAFASWHEKPPLVIYGPGGIGKSTLVAKFLLEHAKVDEDKRFPFVYLDFDRADLSAAEPLTILLEALRQIGIQWPSLRTECDALRRRWTQQIVRAQRSPANVEQSTSVAQYARAPVLDRSVFIGDIERFMARPEIADRPVLLVLDTFEEVQARSQAAVEQMTGFLEDLQRAVPRLRTVFSGRAPIDESADSPSGSGRTQPMPLLQLDPQSAAAILRMDGMPEPLASRTAGWVGGHPLVLQLAAELLRRLRKEHGDATGIAMFEADAARARLEEGGVQRFLYARILDHISSDDPRVRAIAHPGLVLRRLTPELIFHVLAEPCEIQVADMDDAERLLTTLSNEVALVTATGEREVRHRPDLRKLMLKAISGEAGRGATIAAIHQRAVRFYADEYERSAAAIDRAEELYHRLALDEPHEVLESRWVDAVQPLLFTVVDELPAAARAWLSSKLRVELDSEARSVASIDVWERDAERRAAEFLVFDQPGRALDVVRERSARTAASPLFVLEARALEAAGDPEAAIDVCDAAIEQTFRAGADAVRLDVLLAGADIERRRGEPGKAAERLGVAESLARQRGDLVALLRVSGSWLLLLDSTGASAGPAEQRRAIGASAPELFERLSDRELLLAPDSARRLAAELVESHLPIVRRVLRVVGFGAPHIQRLADLARAVERWDAELGAAGEEAGSPLNIVALRKVLEQNYSLEQLFALLERAREGTSLEVGDASTLAASEAPALTLIAMFERAGGLPALVAMMEEDRTDIAAAARRSTGPIGRLFDLQNAPDGTIASLVLETPTLLPVSLDRAFDQFTPPASVRSALAAILRASDQPIDTKHESQTQTQLRLTEAQLQVVREALLDAFPSYAGFRHLLLGALDANLESISGLGKPLQQVVLDLLTWATAKGRLAELLSAAQRANPGNLKLQEALALLGLTPALEEGGSSGIMERLRTFAGGRSSAQFDVDVWRQHLTEVESRVCLVSVSTGGAAPVLGTGVLVAEDLVLTSRVLLGHGDRTDVNGWCLFDHREMGGSVVDPGTKCPLSPEPILDEDEAGEYALLRLSRPLGYEPAGGTRALPGARPRGWVVLPVESSIEQNGAILLVQNNATGALKAAVGGDVILRGTAVEYRITTELGASGAPVFDAEFRLIAIHQGRGSSWLWNVKRGTAIAAIVERLQAKGLFERLPQSVPSGEDMAL